MVDPQPPRNAASGTSQYPIADMRPSGRSPPNTMAVIAPSPAPALTPTSPGSARGLRNKPCMSAPETASDAPTHMPRIIRGMRISQSTTRSIWLSGCPENNFCRAPQREVPEAPMARLEMLTTHNRATNQKCARRAVSRRSRGALMFAIAANGSTSVEGAVEVAHGLGGSRAEAQQIKSVHSDHCTGFRSRG